MTGLQTTMDRSSAELEREISGAEIVVRALRDEGVEFVFGYPGGAVLYIYDELARQEELKHILVRHEQAAVHAADAYARATGRVGVALVTSGPGATNAVTGIATAYMDSVPLVIITGQVPVALIGNDAFQEVDTVGITRPCTKHNFLVKDVADLASTLKTAFFLAASGRPGPVLVDIPKDITAKRCVYRYPDKVQLRSYKPTVKGHAGQVRKAVQLIASAERPMFYTGGGIILGNAAEALTAFVRHLGAPITNTLMGLGGFPASDPQFLGMLGMHGTFEANMAVQHSDVLVALGARFDDRVTGNVEAFAPHARIVHVDVDPSSISKNVKVDVPIVGDLAVVLAEMDQAWREGGHRLDPAALKAWWEQIASWRARECLRYEQGEDIIKPQYVVQKLHELTGGDAIVTSDVGQHQMWAAQFYGFDAPRRWINSGGLGTMGYGLPAAMGAQLADPERTVVCITGEGSIQMNIQELSTCLQHRLPIKIACLNNHYLGMVRQWQEFFYESRYAMSYVDALPDFVKLAEAYGHIGLRADRPADVEPVIREALRLKDRLVFMDFQVDPTENVYPMVPAGAALSDMILL
ncbi:MULTISPECIES: biosynthetic-type acetolactate synthase large subunit [Acidithiobacillus]|jgi:acetolactate synthase-1/2/3 large subunit|uniref:Acetolactate synthase n=2 Tax=Acidithiobacillus caldus TaxID=33059 RepID=F9ZP27_ACICS|nr:MULTISPECIES: biosynthetic-type acetolactate synthase large subunit [Acidithiobacillus]AEK58414.1 Acetolactate synthase large subunit [Acidithiobacillus caldus SM-1]AUW33007.1 biosynthetic-type acetolactate synthase large subunit [Acidithiobacillus caldus]MBU2762001.1 biosynthetic-type acetolactate synthase large subunit [Acidithiobacillus caldus]MBU2771287.1 biosynthetic-type acetolactate synthase large subunit [Acidithiobacillus caldus]MBU2790941.1 biosynthetic-type acetolactate synthase 